MTSKPVEWDAVSYDKLSDPQFSWGIKLLPTLPLRGDETVLDAGCGSGRLTEELLKRLPDGRIVALDLSSNMLQNAQERLAWAGKRVLFQRCDLSNFRLPEPVDGIFSNAAFHWVPDHDSMFPSLFRALKSGGWLIAQFGGEGNLAKLKSRTRELCNVEPFAKYMKEFSDGAHYETEAVTRRRMENAGFVGVETSRHPEPVRFPDAASMKTFVSKVNLHRYLAALPDELSGQFADKLVEIAANDDPPYTLDYMRLTIRGKKP
ncbi:MAG TPA: methyltransferase domain-containing protein [Terriglobales bacterium]|nr:methyltransferase domain-containing protein [Terriglobales bacterium]